MKTKPPAGRPLPPQWRNVIELEFHRQLTGKERLKLFLGFNLDIKLKIATQHHPGHFNPAMELFVTPAVKPKRPWYGRMFKRE